MVTTYVYPTTIQTTTGHSTKYGTQNITNKANLCSNSTNLAYWGIKNPTWKGNYMRNWPDSVTTPSGSFSKPETIYATGWEINVPNNSTINNITIEYKWEQISYSSTTAYGTFDKPTISVVQGSKTLASFKGAKPEAYRYHNNTINDSKKNTNSAELNTLHTHTVDLKKYDLTAKDLKKIKIKFDPAKNTSKNHCRIVMQFIRLKVNYKEKESAIVVHPTFQVKSNIDKKEVTQEEKYQYSCMIETTNSSIDATSCLIQLDDDIKIDNIQQSSSKNTYDAKTNTWIINDFNGRQAKITFDCISTKIGIHNITASVIKYSDSINNSTTASINVVPDIPTFNITLSGENYPYIFKTQGESISKCLKIHLNKVKTVNNAYIDIDTDGWLSDGDLSIQQGEATLTYQNDGKWKISNITTSVLDVVTLQCKSLSPGIYHIAAGYHYDQQIIEKEFDIHIVGPTLEKEYFKLRLEDGSDVRYNSLMFTPGDDLQQPLTYEDVSEDILTDNMMIVGEKKTIPTSEARYLTFTIDIDDTNQKTYENIFCHIDIIDINTNELCNDILLGADNQIQIFSADESKFCIIDNITTNQTKKIKFVVQSDLERQCKFLLKPFNIPYNDKNKWQYGEIYFQDLPNIRLKIDVNNDDVDVNGVVTATYTIENRSTKTFCANQEKVNGYKFKITEPFYFKTLSMESNDIVFDNTQENNNMPYYNAKNKIITFPCIEGATQSNEIFPKKYVMTISYQITKKGKYELRLCTEDNPKYIEDDQYKNCAIRKILAGINNNIHVATYVNNDTPFVDELFDYTIKIQNFDKKQDEISFHIQDIGAYETNHNNNHYEIEYIDCEDSTFTPSTNNNEIGVWTIKNVDINDEYTLVLTLRPIEIGYHTIKAIMSNNNSIQDYTTNQSEFNTLVNVFEKNKQISFNVYHAVSFDNKGDCEHCDELTEICDEDYINLNDELYYVFDITNNNRNPIEESIYIYARLPKNLIKNGILCHTPGYSFSHNEVTGLISFKINHLEGCSNKKICMKIQPSIQGIYTSNFMLTNRNAHTYHKSLKIHVNSYFNEKKMEHEIAIYNFEKTNRYFRYELDGDNNLYKFFNQGNTSLRNVNVEDYKESSIEYYRGTNLKKIIRQIANESKYVEPELLRIGNNKFADKGYEIYPDGFMRRFGLLNSEIFHYAGQLPTVTNTVNRAMRWDIDNWDEKVWGSDTHSNGVFDLSIDYSKIPTNFDIVNIDDPVGKLQAIVDKVKPFGTKAICYYSDTIHLNMATDLDIQNSLLESNINYDLSILPKNLGLISLYNRHDNSLAAYYDLLRYDLKNNIINVDTNTTQKSDNFNIASTEVNIFTEVYDYMLSKKNINDCFDIIEHLYLPNTYTKNIDITKDFKYNQTNTRTRSNIITVNKDTKYTFQYDNTATETQLNINDQRYIIKYESDDFKGFKGIVIYHNDDILFKKNFNIDINTYHIQIECSVISSDTYIDDNIIHIWCRINNDDKYYHIGYIKIQSTQNIHINSNVSNYEIKENENELITFQITNDINAIIKDPNYLIQDDNKYKWYNQDKFFKKHEYMFIKNDEDIDIVCDKKHQHTISTPIIGIKYDNININPLDEIYDIKVMIDATSNKENFVDDIAINLHKDGDKYIPENNIKRETYYPQSISNVYQEYISSIILQQENITVCSHCLKTSLGYYDKCPYCSSELVSHYNDKHAITICNQCHHISDGWFERCPHCLSYDIELTESDYNKTYCLNCGDLENDYYPKCPKCFSDNIVHLTNREYKYKIKSDSTQNIDPITVQSDVQRIKMCNITLPFNINTSTLEKYENIKLHLHGFNNNDGKFYYCESCGKVGIGEVKKCPICKATNITQYQLSNTIMDIYLKVGEGYYHIDTNDNDDIIIDNEFKLNNEFDIAIDVKKIVQKNDTDEDCKLIIYVENLLYDQIQDTINKLDADIKEKTAVLNDILKMNVYLDNIYYDTKLKDTNEWESLEQMEGINHMGITFNTKDNNYTEYISFNDFNFNTKPYQHLYLHINGINKSYGYIKMQLMITDKNDNVIYTNNTQDNILRTDVLTYNDEEEETVFYDTVEDYNNIRIKPDLFQYKIDVMDIVDVHQIADIANVKIAFRNITENTDLIITDCYFIGEQQTYQQITNLNVDKKTYNIQQQNNKILFSTIDCFALKEQQPYYLDGKQLETNLVCYIDFGELNVDEYIRLYDVDLLIFYKNKYGKISTETINMSDAIHNKHLINGIVNQNNAETWGSIQSLNNILNNLEYEIINDDNEDSLTAIPLMQKLAQSFIIDEDNISHIDFNYYGQIGNPNNQIIIQIFDDQNNNPDNLLYTKYITLPNLGQIISIDIDLDNLQKDEKYWIVLVDNSADEYNYHRFRYNNNLGIGNLLYYSNDKIQRDQNKVLSFSVDSNINALEYYDLPTTLDYNETNIKLQQSLFRYNTNNISNAYITELSIQSGYTYYDEEDVVIDNTSSNDDDSFEIEYGE